MRSHPHHSLPVLFALKNSHADHLYSQEGQQPPVNARISAAAAMLRQAEKRPETAQHVFEMASFTEALIHFANIDVGKPKANVPGKISKVRTYLPSSISSIS